VLITGTRVFSAVEWPESPYFAGTEALVIDGKKSAFYGKLAAGSTTSAAAFSALIDGQNACYGPPGSSGPGIFFENPFNICHRQNPY